MADSLINKDGTLNTKSYNEKLKKQREVFGKIDTVMAALEKLPMEINEFPQVPLTPLRYLFDLIKTLGVDEETLKGWIVEILVYVLPAVEIGVKASLLANIKSLISCNADPRIPLRFRKKVTDTVYTNILRGHNEDRGIDINIDAIDPQGLLDLSPFTNPGLLYYFGCTDDSVYDSTIEKTVSKYDDTLDLDTTNAIGDGNSRPERLVRADDFNAFLWYVIHKGNKQNPAKVTIEDNTFKIDGDDENTYQIVSSNKSLLGVLEIKPNGKSKIIAGNTFYDANNANNIAICIESKIDENTGEITGNTILPVSSDWYSCNWYVDKTNYYGSNLGVKKRKPRDYAKEKAICNLRFCKQYDYTGREIPEAPNNIRFTILPKPYVLLPSIDMDEEHNAHVQWRPIRLLFDSDGNPDQKGKFSLISETYDLQPTLKKIGNDGDYTSYDVKGIGQDGNHEVCAVLKVNTKTGKYILEDKEGSNLNKNAALVECYPGLTVYEFNYDYIMGMKLFDPKVVCQKILDATINPRFDLLFNFSSNGLSNRKNRYPYLEGKLRIIEIVRKLLDEDDDDEINDCFFSFSNEQYDEMLRKTEEIRYRQLPYNQGYNDGESVDFTEVTAILNEFPENGSLEQQKEVINRALTYACDVLEKRKNITTESDTSTTKVDFLTDLLQQLVAAIIDSILSPKVLMLLIVNRALMDTQVDEPFNTEALMRILKNVIKSLVKEVRDLIMKKLLDYILQYLMPLALELKAKVLKEQFEAYMAILRLLMSWYNKGVEVVTRLNSILSALLSKLKNKRGNNIADYGDITEMDLPTMLDDVYYADIYPSNNKDKEPIYNDC